MPPAGTPRAVTRDAALRAVRALLDDAGYGPDGIRDAGIEPGLGARATDVPWLLHALEDPEPRRTLIRLFFLGQPIAAVEARRRIGEAATTALAGAGLLERRGAMLVPTLAVTPWRGMLVAHDPDPPGDLWPDHVAGPNPATDALAALIVPDAVEDALDLGTGSGALALLAAPRARSVTATDVNPRALRYASINAVLNDVAGVAAVEGSLFEPVAGRMFGSIVSNPPFVISPEHELLFRHSAHGRDELSRAVVRGAAEHLAEGGFAHVLCNWIQPAGEAWRAPVERWLAGTGCDVLVLVHGVESALDYAVRWNLRRQQVVPDAWRLAIDRWVAYARAERIERITSAAVILRRRAGRNWLHDLELGGETRGDAGEHVRAIFHAVDHLQAHEDAGALARTRVRLRGGHRLDQALVDRGGDDYAVEPGRLSLVEGLATSVEVAPELVPVLLRLDGSRSIAAVAADVAAEGGEDEPTIVGRAVPFVRELLGKGLAEPVGHGAGTAR